MSSFADGGTSGIAVYGPRTLINFSTAPILNTLADATTAISDAINNSSARYPEYIIQINIAGTAAATAWLDPRLLASCDGGLTFQTYENGFVLPPIALSVTPIVYMARILAPEYWKLAVRNNTGAILTTGIAYFQGIRR